MVQATTSETSSAIQELSGVNAAKRGRAKGRQGFSFAAILEKALAGPAAPEKAGRLKGKGVSRAVLQAGPKTGKTPEESLLRPEKNIKNAEKRNLPPREEDEQITLPGAEELQPEKRVTELSQAAAQTAAAAVRETRTPDGDGAASFRNAAAENVSLFAQGPAPEEALVSGSGFGIPAREETPAAGGKPKAGAEKKLPLHQEAGGARRKEERGEAAKKNEAADNAVLSQELKPSSPEEAKQETPRQEIEIRVVMRAGDERFDDTLRTVEERGIKESASGLLRRLREDANGDIVRSARFILKDRNEGEIRLVLKPETLGEVRIRISMQDNLIGGRIFVENENVRAVFEQNMPDLAAAFKESGMELGSLNVSVGNGESRESGENHAGFAAREAAPAERETVVSTAQAAAYYFVSHAVNVMA